MQEYTKDIQKTCKNILFFSSQVGHAVSTDDAVYLLKHYHINMNSIYDTLVLANQLGLRHLSLQKLAGVFLGQNLCKKQRMSNWERNQLLDKQISYACNDAWTSLKVYEAMKRFVTYIVTRAAYIHTYIHTCIRTYRHTYNIHTHTYIQTYICDRICENQAYGIKFEN